MTLLIAAVWLACGVAAAGFIYAYFQRAWPSIADEFRASDIRMAWFALLTGPVSLIVVYQLKEYTHGWLLPGRKP